jgi:long-subunit acyl-CoA synthetase (AMP-forming)
VALADERRQVRHDALAGLVDAAAGRLRACGGRRFALLADNGCDWALADLALQRAGLLNVPLPGYFTPAQQAHVLADAGVDALLTDDPAAAVRLPGGFAPAGTLAGTGLALLQRPAPATVATLPSGTLKITYTSGSTGQPRGVCLSGAAQAAVARSLASATAELGLERHLCLLPLATLLENVAGIHAALLAGACCHIPSLATTGMSYGQLDPARLVASISRYLPSSLILVPELLRLLLQAAAGGWQPPASLRFVAVGGATVSPDLLDAARQAGLPVYEGYGLSECGSVVCLNTPGSRRTGSVGRPLPHVRVRVDDQQQLRVRGPVMGGYLGDAPLAADADGCAEIATGDLGHIDADGFVYVRGRRKNLLITSLGRNVSPEWVERELLHEPVIAHALVCGEARPWLAAVICPAGPAVTREAVALAVERANGRLPDYARIRNFALAGQPFTAANGSLTTNGRLRRDHLLAVHQATIDGLYRDIAATAEATS